MARVRRRPRRAAASVPAGRRRLRRDADPHRRRSTVPRRPRPDAARHRDHPGRARPDCCSTSPARRPRSPRRIVTVAPDVSSRTNLGGWVNKVGVWSAASGGTGSPTTPTRSCTGASADRAAHRARHRRDQPGRTDRRARRDLEPVGPAAAADRRAVRPVRRAGAGAVVVRDLRRRPVDPGRNAVRGLAGAGGRRPPVDQDPVDRAGAARLHQRTSRPSRSTPSGACWRRSAGWAGRAAGRPTCGCRPGRSTRRSPRCPPTRLRASGAGGRSSPARTGCGARRPGRDHRGDGRGGARGARGRRPAGGAGVAADVVCVTSPDLLFRALRPAGAGDRRTLDPRSACSRPTGPCRW